jgi:hypothetical protein
MKHSIFLLLAVSYSLLAQESTDWSKLKKTLGENIVSRLLKPKQGEALMRPTDLEFNAWASPTYVLLWKPVQPDRITVEDRKAFVRLVNRAIKASDSNDSAANAAGSLSPINNSSLANALGLVLGSGGLAQSTQKTTGTISSNLYVLLCGSFTKSLFASETAPNFSTEVCKPGANPLKNLTFSLTLKDQEDQVQLRRPLEGIGAAQVRWDLYNKRDPRLHVKSEHYKLVAEANQRFAKAARNLHADFSECTASAAQTLKTDYGEKGFDNEDAILESFNKIHSAYQACANKNPASASLTATSLLEYREQLGKLETEAKKTWALAVTYDFVRQSLPNASPATTDTTPKASTTPAPTALPSLSSFGLTWDSGQHGRFKYSGAFHTTLFNNAPTNSGDGLRDFRVTNDFELKLIQNAESKLNGMKFNLSGIFLDLRREPLGQKVLLFGKTATSPGKMGVVVGKLTIPGPNETSKIPISLSYATRSELLPDKEWRAGIGYTFNWRQLFQ